ncbi:MAG: translocation/assembly module TamB domain-containing protein [Pseudomonadota bacterium]
MSETEHTTQAKPPRRRKLRRGLLFGALAFVVLVLGLAAAVRYGALVPQVRTMIEARAEGVKLGRIGRLRVEGLSGDIWRDLRIKRVTIRDEQGVWLEARDVHLVWRYWELFRRRFDADLIEAREIRVLRRPSLGPKGQDRGLPVSFYIDEARARLIMEPEFSYTQGVYDVDLALVMTRGGRQSGSVEARSILHPGDRAEIEFDLRRKGPLTLRIDAREARGGALAGALGLPADRPFLVDIKADGSTSQGRFTAIARSGDVSPLSARGAWSPQGGRAAGRILLTASELTAPLARRIGPEVRFGVAGVSAEDDFYAMHARFQAEALSGRIWGRANVGTRAISPRGLQVEAQTPSLSRVAGTGELGSARVSGVFRGDPAAFRFAGRMAVNEAGLGGYALARVGGTFEVRREAGRVDLQARLAGEGGRGAGYLAALLGGAPTANVQAQRLADGQLLLEDLRVDGRGLDLDASGRRGLLGGVSLQGQARLSNLEAARIGASGAATIDFQAQQARAGAPWSIAAKAQGQRFAAGFAQLDRLLGDRPRLEARAAWNEGRLELARAQLDGAALDATASGVLARDRTLGFDIDWTASGPLRAGPVEITGQATGDGAVAGSLSAPRLEMTANFEEIDLPRLPLREARMKLTFQRQADGSNGTIDLAARSQYGPARAASAFSLQQGGVDLTGLDVDAGGLQAEGSLALRRRTPSAADLRVRVEQGAFLDAGLISGTLRIVDGAGPAQADLALRAENARLAGSQVSIGEGRLTAEGPLTRLPYVLAASGRSPQGNWKVDGRGVVSDLEDGYQLAFEGGGDLGGRDLRTTETAIVRVGGERRSARLRLASGEGGRIALDAELLRETADIDVRVAQLDLELVNPDLAGRIDATLSLQGGGEALSGVLAAQLADARGRGSPAAQGIDGTVRGRLSETSLTLDVDTTNQQGLRAQADVVLPVETSAQPFRIAIARQRPISGRFSAEGEVRPLWELAIGGERSLSGVVRTQGTLSGTLAAPRARGTFAVDQGRFEDGATGLDLRDLHVRAAFTEDAVNVSEVRGVDGHGGGLTGQGRISLLRDGVSSFRLDLKGFRLIDNEMATASATGQATLNRAADGKVKITGDLLIDRADVAADPPVPSGVVSIDVKEINRPASLPPPHPPQVNPAGGWALDVKLRAPRRVFLRGRGLDLELSLDAHVGGTTATPNLTGEARVVRGDYEFAGKRFEFDDRSVVYLSTRPDDIRLQLDATREDPTLTVTVRIRGTAARPDITLASSPSLPNDEILAQVLFGRSAAQLSGVEAAQLAAAISSLRGGGGLDVIGNLRTFAGLDRLAFGGGEESGVTVSGGKYLTEDIYLEITGGGREGPSAQVEWRVSRKISILSRIAGQAGNRIAVRWREDY